MKLLLHYAAGPNLSKIVAALPAPFRCAVVVPGDEAGLKRELADTEILLHVLESVTMAMIDAAPRLKLIQKIGVGVDAIDLVHAKHRGVAVCNMPGTNTAAVAELALGLMLSCLRRIPTLATGTASATSWAASRQLGDSLGEIGGRTVGLIGFGAVPQRLAPVLSALGARVIATSRTLRPHDGVEFVPLETLLSAADIVSLHLPATPETHNLLDARRIRTMKPGAILINTARGSLVDEAALASALSENYLAAAGLDVFATEPLAADNPLPGLPNVICTPHLAWLTRETLGRSMAVALENAHRLSNGADLLHRVA